MMYLILFLLALWPKDPREIAQINGLKAKAQEAYMKGDFELALSYCEQLDTLTNDPAIKLNLGHAFFFLGDTSNAEQQYKEVVTQTKGALQSLGYQQLGFIQKQKRQYEGALESFKQSLLADSDNEDARYNYEVVKKLLEKQKEEQDKQDKPDESEQEQEQENQQDQQDQQDKKDNQSGEGQEQENQEQQQQESQDSDEQKEGEEQQKENKEGEEKQPEEPSREEMVRKKLEEMNINEEKAKMILEALRNNEIQYIQQQKRKATRPESNKPDW